MASARLLQITDPVHGHIPVDARFMDIIDTPEFQRLRSIEQGSFRPVFPGARHDRFIHSVGTYYLGCKFVDHFFTNLQEDVEGISLPDDEIRDLRATFQYAALLHDLGHAPFSHTTEALFTEQKDPATGLPLIWTQLCDEVKNVADPDAYVRFRDSTAKPQGAPHEIMSAILLIRNRKKFLPAKVWGRTKVDLELAARMVIGYLYTPGDVNAPDPDRVRDFSIRNCLIQLLNSKVMDVDRLDYLGRDTRMSGFSNAPLDLDVLAASVTAVDDGSGWLVPAYRSSALSAIETMFHAKLSHDAWVLSHPAGAYDAALRHHCIRLIDQKHHGRYIPTVFSVDAMGTRGVSLGRKKYRLLCDSDIATDMKAQDHRDFDELFSRQLNLRRISSWNSYYEFRYIFTDPASGLTPDYVNRFFTGLIEYMDKHRIFAFTGAVCAQILADVPEEETGIRNAAVLLDRFLSSQQRKSKNKNKDYSAVLMKRSINFTMKLDPEQVRIVFTKKYFPADAAVSNWTTYGELMNLSMADWRRDEYFYLFRNGRLGCNQLQELRDLLAETLSASH